MAEVSFAQTFLTTLDSRPIKLSPDHVEDPRNYPARQPVSLYPSNLALPAPLPTTTESGGEKKQRLTNG